MDFRWFHRLFFENDETSIDLSVIVEPVMVVIFIGLTEKLIIFQTDLDSVAANQLRLAGSIMLSIYFWHLFIKRMMLRPKLAGKVLILLPIVATAVKLVIATLLA